MEQSVLAEVGLPASIFLVMTALGLALEPTDFRRLIERPRPVLTGLAAQLVGLPVVGFAMAFAFDFDPVIAISLVLIAAVPGGPTSNLIVHATDGERALSVSLTALSSSVTWITIPVFLALAFDIFGASGDSVDVPFFETMAQVALITLVPVALGMAIRSRRPDLGVRSLKPGRVISTFILVAIIVALAIENIELIVEDGPSWAPALILFNAISLGTGYGVAKLVRLGRRSATTIAIETGIQNAVLAITIALVSLDSSPMSVIPALYGLWMLISGFGFAFLMLGRRGEAPSAAAG